MGKGLCQQLADRKPETQPERVQDHEEHPEPVDQDALTGLSHIAPFSRADDPAVTSAGLDIHPGPSNPPAFDQVDPCPSAFTVTPCLVSVSHAHPGSPRPVSAELDLGTDEKGIKISDVRGS